MDEVESNKNETYGDNMNRIFGALSEEYSKSPEARDLAQRLTDGDRYKEPQYVSVEKELEEEGIVRLEGENGTVTISDGDIVSARYSTGLRTVVNSALEVEASATELELADERA